MKKKLKSFFYDYIIGIKTSKMNGTQLKLNDATLQVIMDNNGITKEQAEELWVKSLSFNRILATKFGDTYNNNLDEIQRLMHQYLKKVIDKFKSEV